MQSTNKVAVSKAMVVMLLGAGTALAILGGVKYQQIKIGKAMISGFKPPPQAVTTVQAQKEKWSTSLSAIGTVSAVRGVTLSADLPGVVASIDFESGHPAQTGQVLVRLDTRQERAQLAAAEAARNLAHLNFERAKSMHADGAIPQAELDKALAEDAQADARMGEIRATIDRKTIRAPFSGVLGIRRVNLGQYLNGGEPIVSLQAVDPVYVNFSIPQQDVPRMQVGGTVKVSAEGLSGEYEGKITAVDSVVDPATRNMAIQATLKNPAGHLHSGMFVNTHVQLGSTLDAVAVPASAIKYAPYGDSIFVVSELTGPKGEKYRGVREQAVKLGESRGDQVAVVSGIQPGSEIVTSGTFKLRNQAAVLVNNDLQPTNNPAPTPENN